MIDIHSHIIPEIDDGARSLKESLEMAEIAAADGIQQIVATPHMFNGLSHDPEPAEVLQRVAALQAVIGDKLKILPGNEVHISHEIVNQATKNRVTKINHKNHLLVEFPRLMVPLGAVRVFQELRLHRVFPILVHPERNAEIQAHPSIVAGFVEVGVLVQLTAMSLTGEFGAAARTCAETLLQHNCVHFLATDTHRSRGRPPILSKGRDAAAALIGEEKARRLVFDNPLAVISGRTIPMQTPLPFSSAKRAIASRFLS